MEKFLDNNKISVTKKLQPVYSAIEKTRVKLDKRKSLIAFIGAPWTLLIYMYGVKLDKNNINFEKINSKKSEIKKVINKLHEFLCIHIDNQIKAGADVIQIFDSWAGLLPELSLNNYCINPNLKLVNFCKKKNIPVVCFPKGIGINYKKFNDIVKPDGINLDYTLNPSWAKQNLKNVVIQGGLDPKILLSNESEIIKNTEKYLNIFNDIPYVFNLGHGLLPETDPDKVEKLIKFYRKY
tara:strand:- start:3150 stop:3863 length:714 start_codon:yes stop_codon:yes gene_type:complete